MSLRSQHLLRALGSLATFASVAVSVGCSSSEPDTRARTEALDETTPIEAPPEVIGPPAHAAIPSWVPATLHASIEGSRLPVMLPREPAVTARSLSTATVLHEDRWVSTHLETTTYLATIFGTDAHHEPPRGARFEVPEPDRTIRGAAGYAYENEGLYYAQWQEGGIAWDVEIDCLASCDGVGLALEIAESLEAVGGER